MKTGNILENLGMASLFALVLIAAPVRAATLETEEIVYEIADEAPAGTTERFVAQPFGDVSPSRTPLASFGPFHMVASDRAELIGSVETETPAQFAALLRAFPTLKQIDMIDCPGTGDDEANLALARMVRRHGVSTYVPDGGSVRSGGVELFLAGAQRRAAPTAEFAVHSWRDEDGYEADDFAANDPVHQEYIAFYREMGLSDAEARSFYAMTNSAPHDDALYLNSRDLARYVRLD
ncbi:hypothetical protein [uncultured Sphingorhabdus sp.]|jgi:hypothetical protein|uniref:hypothetical protein n=1 Tax=uncultured Sphingorhabdus sp. TaxID=1686106 RepID=UPI002606550F|nr:hypothetical protein [uncultured Sphingorhabdus sp.]HMS19742.1 hypothetical protein [Sphingorhabdus sp.]